MWFLDETIFFEGTHGVEQPFEGFSSSLFKTPSSVPIKTLFELLLVFIGHEVRKIEIKLSKDFL